MKIMVFAPHPDDEVIGCGGSIAAHVRAGDEVAIAYLTSGEAGGLNITPDELRDIREGEALQGAEILGVKDLIFLRSPDGYLDFSPERIRKLVSLVREMKPDVVYVPHAQEGPRDHRVTYELGLEAVHRAAGPWFRECGGEPWPVKHVVAYEVWTPIVAPTYYSDITPWIDIKTAALRCHASQVMAVAYDEAVKGLNRYRGILSGRGDYCEAFQVIMGNPLVGWAPPTGL
jgi:LmbE family N-acetylglucosaminyl deacetylase